MGIFGRRREEGKNKDGDGEKSTSGAGSIYNIAIEPRTHVDEYLKYYVGRSNPGYAVLITGAWGTGKTYQVRRALPDSHAYYVSLFGVDKVEDVDALIFTTMFPRLALVKKVADSVGSVGAEYSGVNIGASSAVSSMLFKAFVKQKADNSKPLILDDLERCTVGLSDLLGAINRYVEHHQCRVIAIAHDEKIVGEFQASKEKVFGHTVRVSPDTSAALEEFITSTGARGKKNIESIRQDVLSVFLESGVGSLRILRHLVEDLHRLLSAFDERHLKHSQAKSEAVRLFSALSIEVRANGLKEAEIKNRAQSRYVFDLTQRIDRSEDGRAPPRILDVFSRYKTVEIGSTILSDEVLIEMLIDGRYDREKIAASLDNSVYFLQAKDAAPWQIVITFDKREDSEVVAAVQKMEDQFSSRSIVESGELLHVVALMMLMASEGIAKHTIQDVVHSAKLYIDDLLASGRLPPRAFGRNWMDSFDQAFGGSVYWVAEGYKTEFQEVFEYLVKAREKALENEYPRFASELMEIMRADGLRFFEATCRGKGSAMAQFEDIPVLGAISVDDFVDNWLTSPKSGWYWIAIALKERYAATDRYESLRSEKQWYAEVVQEMKRRGEGQPGLAGFRIARAAALVPIPAN